MNTTKIYVCVLSFLCLLMVACGSGDYSEPDSTVDTPIVISPPDPAPDPEPVSLSIPQLSVESSDQRLTISWSESNAHEYRVIYAQTNSRPTIQTTDQLSIQTSPLDNGWYSIYVEALDENGHGLFSSVFEIEVSQ